MELPRRTSDIAIGDAVRVTEPGIRPWAGIVIGVKPSVPSKGWWFDVRTNDDYRVWGCHESTLSKADSESPVPYGVGQPDKC